MQSQNQDLPPTAEDLKSHQNEKDLQRPVIRRSRNQTPMRINADDESRCMLILYLSAIVFPLFVALMIVVFAIPNASEHVDSTKTLPGTTLSSCHGNLYKPQTNSTYLECMTAFNNNSANAPGMFIRGVSNLNQFLVFYLDLAPFAERQGQNGPGFNEEVTFNIYTAGVEPETSKIKINGQIHSETDSVNKASQYLSRSRIVLGVESKISSSDEFYWEVIFKNGSQVTSPSDFYLHTETVKPNFTIYTILLRVFFFLVALGVFIKYTYILFYVPKNKVSIQQKLIHFISALTLCFNDQLYFITVLFPNPVTSFISGLFVWNFFFALFAFWACMLLRMYYQQSETQTVVLKAPHRVVPFTIFYFCGLMFSVAFAVIQYDEHPIISPHSVDNGFFTFLTLATIIGFFLVIIYILYLFASVCRDKPHRSYRNTIFMIFSTFFFMTVIVVVALGSLDIFTYSSGLVMFSFAIPNLYSFLIQYLYSPTSKQIGQFMNGTREYQIDPRVLVQIASLDQRQTIDLQISIDDQDDLTYSQDTQDMRRSIKSDKENGRASLGQGSVRKQMKKKRRQSIEPQMKKYESESFGSDTRQRIVKEDYDPPFKAHTLEEEMQQQMSQNLK